MRIANTKIKVVEPFLTEKNVDDLPIEDVVEKICKVNKDIRKFWSNSKGWAPVEAAELLCEVRLDWHAELSTCLHKWVHNENSEAPKGSLILAWVNLGALEV
ncbi:MAG: hypothetical protein AAGH42_07555 [Pseudomonadota bacterium]